MSVSSCFLVSSSLTTQLALLFRSNEKQSINEMVSATQAEFIGWLSLEK